MKQSRMLCASLAFAAFALFPNGAAAQAPAPAQAPVQAPAQAPTPTQAQIPPPAGAPATCTGGNNLVQNPGFDLPPASPALSPWVAAWGNPPDPYTHVQPGSSTIPAASPPSHGGTHYLAMGAVPGLNSVTQNINGTVAGQIYTVCFWLKHDPVLPNGSAQNSFEVRWGGRALFTVIGSLGFEWTQFRFAVRATGTDALRFDAQEVPAFWHLDDVGVYLGGPTPFARIAGPVDKKAP
jgi:hypothetical protein